MLALKYDIVFFALQIEIVVTPHGEIVFLANVNNVSNCQQ